MGEWKQAITTYFCIPSDGIWPQVRTATVIERTASWSDQTSIIWQPYSQKNIHFMVDFERSPCPFRSWSFFIFKHFVRVLKIQSYCEGLSTSITAIFSEIVFFSVSWHFDPSILKCRLKDRWESDLIIPPPIRQQLRYFNYFSISSWNYANKYFVIEEQGCWDLVPSEDFFFLKNRQRRTMVNRLPKKLKKYNSLQSILLLSLSN